MGFRIIRNLGEPHARGFIPTETLALLTCGLFRKEGKEKKVDMLQGAGFEVRDQGTEKTNDCKITIILCNSYCKGSSKWVLSLPAGQWVPHARRTSCL